MVIENKQNLVDILIQQGKLKTDIDPKWRELSNLDVEKKLREEHLVSEEDIARGYAGLYRLPYVKLSDYQISFETLNLIPEQVAQNYKIISFKAEKSEDGVIKIIHLALADPARLSGNLCEVISSLERQKNIKIQLAIISGQSFSDVINRYKNPNHETTQVTQPKPSIPPTPPLNYKTINLDPITIPYEVITKFPENISQKYQMVVFEAPNPSAIKVAISDPQDQKVREILDFIKTKNDISIEEYKVTPSEITRALRFYDPKESAPKPPPPPSPKIEPKPAPLPKSQEINKDQKYSPLSPPPPQEIKHEEKPEIRQEKIEEPKQIPQPIPPQPQKPQEKPIPEIKKDESTPEVQGPNRAQLVVPVENDLDKFLDTKIQEIADLKQIAETGNVPKIVAAAIMLAVSKKASDIHIEATEQNVRIRFRIDGLLRDILKLPKDLQPALVSRVKILSKLKIDESRIPQDGRFDCIATGHAIDLRISTLPTVHGEKIAMRILDKSAHLYTLEELGVAGRGLKILLENMNKPYGIILSTGPTGSGKTTTLYAILTRVSNASVNIVTLEDPVEYEMAGINQCQIRPKIGFTFANGLRSILRQDPNIIMVGEIRDGETAALSTHAALTGHLVLSTLHTNDAAGALPRLTDMGVEPFFITSLINAIIGQRLVRKLCPKCKRKAHIPEPIFKEIEKELSRFNLPKPYQFFEGAGCDECELGYKGRIGIFEVLTMSSELENLVLSKKTSNDIKNQAVKEGMVTMKQDGLIKALKGLTTVNEVMRVITV